MIKTYNLFRQVVNSREIADFGHNKARVWEVGRTPIPNCSGSTPGGGRGSQHYKVQFLGKFDIK